MPMRSSRQPLTSTKVTLAGACLVTLLLAGCGWSPGGPALETPTAIAPLVLQPPATRSAELLTLVAMMPPTATPLVADTPTPAPIETPTPLAEVEPPPFPTTESPAPETPVVTTTPEATSPPTHTDTPELAATIEITSNAVTMDGEASSTPFATEMPEEEPPEAESVASETAPASSGEAGTDDLEIVSALRATTITLPLAGAVTDFPLVDGWHGGQENRETAAGEARVRLLSPVTEGDLTGDGNAEIVALAEIGVGERSLVYLLAFANEGAESETPAPVQVARVLVGADVRVGVPRIEDGVVRLEVDQWQERSPFCCPVRRQLFGYALQGDMLAMVESEEIAIDNGEVALNELSLPQQVATAEQARDVGLIRTATRADEANVNAINLYTVTVAPREEVSVRAMTDSLPVRLFIASADEPVLWRDGSGDGSPFAVTLPTTQTIWIGVQGIEMATPYTLTVTLAPAAASR